MINLSEFTQKWKFLQSKQVFLGCSGGADSVALFHLLRLAKIPFTVLHVNYHLRNEASNEDATFVEELCNQYQVSFYKKEVETKKILDEYGGNLQEETRKIRFEWFETFMQTENDFLVLAHHQDDQIETFFQHIARKSGMLGLACMLEKHQHVIRPLLSFEKSEILDFLRVNQFFWREDQSNSESNYSRNKLRNLLLPSVYESIPSLKQNCLYLISIFQQNQQIIEKVATPLVSSIRSTEIWRFTDFDCLSNEVKVEVLRQFSMRVSVLNEMNKMRNSAIGKFIRINGTLITVREHGFEFLDTILQKSIQPNLEIQYVKQLPTKFSKDEIYLDETKISGKLMLRNWQIGDRISPIGIQGSKLVSSILKEAKLNTIQKQNAFVLTDDSDILWLVGLKIGRKSIPIAQSNRIIRVRLVY
jgi:tRNA(Ile)-lysidine synthase